MRLGCFDDGLVGNVAAPGDGRAPGSFPVGPWGRTPCQNHFAMDVWGNWWLTQILWRFGLNFCYVLMRPILLLAINAVIWNGFKVITDFLQSVNRLKSANQFCNMNIEQNNICSSFQAAPVCEAIKTLRLESLCKNLCWQISALLVFSVYWLRKCLTDVVPNIFIKFFHRGIFIKKAFPPVFGSSLTINDLDIFFDPEDREGQRFSNPWAHFSQCCIFVGSEVEICETRWISPTARSFFGVWNHSLCRMRMFFFNTHVIFWREHGTNLSTI